MNKTVDFIKDRLKRNEPPKYLAASVYDLLTLDARDSVRNAALANPRFKESSEAYKRTLDGLRFSGAIVEDDGTWLHAQYDAAKTRKPERIGAYNVTYKLFFSYIPNSPKDAIAFAERFPILHDGLRHLNVQNGLVDNLQMKIPSKLDVLVRHEDSLVVHYINRAVQPEIKRMVADVYRGIPFEARTARSAGFDLSDGHSDNKTYTELVSRALAEKICRHKDALMRYSDDQFLSAVKGMLKEAELMNPSQMIRYAD